MGKLKNNSIAVTPGAAGRRRKTVTLIDDTPCKAKHIERELVRCLPRQWRGGIEAMRPSKVSNPAVGSFYLREQSSAWLDKLQAFEATHGDAFRWNMSDGDIIKKSKEIAAWVAEFVNMHPAPQNFVNLWPEPLTEAEKLDAVLMVCNSLGVPAPVSITAAGAIARGLSDIWWRRVLRKKIARVVEHGAIKLGVVTKATGGYASDDAVSRRQAQIKRNAEMLGKAVMRNEAGQCYTLAELAKSSTSNPSVRGDELMTRIRGCEEFAAASGHFGTFWALTTPSRFHAVTVKNRAHAKARPNKKYDGVSTPRDAQMWLRNNWALSRSELAREGIEVYGFRVAEPHHDGTPHWHAMLWFKTELAMHQGMAIIAARWMADDGRENGAHEHRVNCKFIESGGAAGYMAKYVAKNIGHYDVGDHLDTLDGLEAAVWAGDVQGWQRVDAWAATWGIRQFQSIGQPSVSIWREMRRVTKDQVDDARQMGGDALPQKIWHAVQRQGDCMADWARYMLHMGGVCLRRVDYALQPAKRVNEVVNVYGEAITQKRIVGLVMASGAWLVSRRQAWARVVDVAPQSPDLKAALAAPWSGFNNCTARLSGKLRAALLGLDRPNLYGALP